jgi:hypothetical protein
LVPGTSGRFRCGGLQVELQTARLLAQIVHTQVVTYRQREPGMPFLADLLRDESTPGEALWIVSWGFDVPPLLRQLRGRPVAYHAHSSGYGFDLPAGVPVLAVSRNTLGYWGDRAPRNPLFLVPNALEAQWLERGERGDRAGSATAAAGQVPHAVNRPIDVLVQQRKNSSYVLKQLVPALRARGLKVEVQAGWVEDLVALFNSASVVLYDSADYWRGRGVSEGFGLPPIEALACGCVVFSSLNHALADSLDPGLVGHQLGAGTLGADLERIMAAAADSTSWQPTRDALAALLESCSEPALLDRWQRALTAINGHWDRLLSGEPVLRTTPRWRIQAHQWAARLAKLTR